MFLFVKTPQLKLLLKELLRRLGFKARKSSPNSDGQLPNMDHVYKWYNNVTVGIYCDRSPTSKLQHKFLIKILNCQARVCWPTFLLLFLNCMILFFGKINVTSSFSISYCSSSEIDLKMYLKQTHLLYYIRYPCFNR